MYGNKKGKLFYCSSISAALLMITMFAVAGWLIHGLVWPCEEGKRLTGDECISPVQKMLRAKRKLPKRNINECDEKIDNCSQICTDISPGFSCSCNSGFQLSQGALCLDINECEKGTSRCQQECVNTDGGYTCECKRGYEKINGGFQCKPTCFGKYSCGDRGECVSPNKCECNSGYIGSYSGCDEYTCGSCENGYCTGPNICTCNDGYRKINGTCQNIDECNENIHNCSQKCRDTIPGFECECYSGYKMNENLTCTDINECVEGTHNCEQNCNNTISSFLCSCDVGYELRKNMTSCKPVCTGAQACGNGGECYAPGECRCFSGYNGTRCQFFACGSCENGSCDGPNQCSCNDGYMKIEGICKPVPVKHMKIWWRIVLVVLALLVGLALFGMLVWRHCSCCKDYFGNNEKYYW